MAGSNKPGVHRSGKAVAESYDSDFVLSRFDLAAVAVILRFWWDILKAARFGNLVSAF